MTTYDGAFFDLIRAGCQASAAVVVPLVMDALSGQPTRTVLDVGCGEGWWAHAFAERGCQVLGIDGAYIPTSPLGPSQFMAHDLTRPLPASQYGRYDLAVCLEVAEHLPPERAAGLVADLCHTAPVVLFSAAVPGQGGHGHINEQWPGYWVQLFHTNGFAVSAALRAKIWNNPLVEPWYRQNLLVATANPGWYPHLFDTPLATVDAVVHPVVFAGRIT